MRRFLAIALVLFFGIGPLAATLKAGDDAYLPACCRRNGAHHCAMSDAVRAWMIRSESRTPGFTAPMHCPLYPNGSGVLTTPIHALAAELHSLPAFFEQPFPDSAHAGAAPSQTVFSRSVRGPPSSSHA